MFNLFKKKASSYSATLSPSGKVINVKKGENLLTAALSAGIKWPYKCRVGSCGTCKCFAAAARLSLVELRSAKLFLAQAPCL